MPETICLVTGATRGLGLEIARLLAAEGALVIAGGRDSERAAAVAAEIGGEAVVIDVEDDGSVRRAAAQVRERHGRLDALVNNAGVLPEATAGEGEAVSAALFRRTFDTNVFGAVTVTEHFLPLLRESSRGRIVNVSSTMGSLADQLDPASPYYGVVVPAYQASKAALNSVTVGLSKLLADTPIKVNSVCPGFLQTDLTPMSREQAPLTAADGARVAVRYALVGDDGPSGGFYAEDAAVAW